MNKKMERKSSWKYEERKSSWKYQEHSCKPLHLGEAEVPGEVLGNLGEVPGKVPDKVPGEPLLQVPGALDPHPLRALDPLRVPGALDPHPLPLALAVRRPLTLYKPIRSPYKDKPIRSHLR